MAIWGLALVALLVLAGAPLWIATISGSAVALLLGYHLDPVILTGLIYEKINVYALLAVPLFILAGDLLNRGGSTVPLIDFLNKMMGHIPGGPAYAVIIACAVLAAMTSGGMAATAGFGPIVVPMLVKMGYSKRFATGLLITGASLGGTIPPSIPLIIFGYITETSIKDLYAAAFLPGAVIALLLAVMVFIYTRRGHFKKPEPSTWQERRAAAVKAIPVLLLPVLVLVPIYTGFNTVTEAAAVAVVYSLILGLFVYRKLDRNHMWQACKRTGQLTSALLLLLIGAMMVNLVLTYMRVPHSLGNAMTESGLGSAGFLFTVMIVFLIMGMFLDPSAILMIVAPMLMPTVISLGISPVLFGVLVVVSIEIAGITPPFGINLFTAGSVLKEDFGFVARSCFMFYPMMILGQLLIAYVPAIALWLPSR